MIALPKDRVPLPLTLDAALTATDWQKNPYWPVRQSELRLRDERLLRAMQQGFSRLDPDFGNIVRLVTPTVRTWYMVFVEAALMARDTRRYDVIGNHEAMRSLYDDELRQQFIAGIAPKALPPMGYFESAFRNFARTLSWSSADNVARNCFHPEIMVVSHNSLLVETARRTRRGIAFRHADVLLNRARQRNSGNVTDKARIAAEWLLDLLIAETVGLPEDIVCRLHVTLKSLLMALAARSERDLSIAETLSWPQEIWMGTFNKWQSRVIGLVVLKRGGKVCTFDHGGGVGNLFSPDFFQTHELGGGNHFVATSPLAADMIRKTLLGAEIPSSRILEGLGDPYFRAVPKQTYRKNKTPRLIYVPTIFRGYRNFGMFLPDPVYLHWQRQVLYALAGMPVASLFKPAPEGLLRGRANPLAGIIPHSYELFEKHLSDADVFLFDCAHTTTLWKALCTNSAVILLDLGISLLGSEMRALLEKRARIILVSFSEEGMPILDVAALRDAVLSARPGDPEPFRALCAGEGTEREWPPRLVVKG
jgi:hypothetical protein